jgi:HEAT repeat protein
VPEHTITALVKLGELAVLPLIEVLLNASVSVWVRKAAVTILAAVGDVRAVKPLIQVLKDKDDRMGAGDGYNRVRAEAALALGQLGDVRAIEPLIEVLKDSDESVRSKAVGALSNFSHSRVVELFIQMLKGRRWSAEMLPNLARFLGKMGDKRAIDPLIKSLNYSNKLRCGFALNYESRENGGYVPLFAGLKVEEPRLAVVEALNQLTGSSAVELLFNILRQPNHPLRPDAAKALGNLGELSQLRLINALKDEDSFVRQSAAEALGNIGDEQAVPALIEALGDGDDKVRLSAIESLRWIDNKKAVEPLMHQLGDSNWQVREAAIRALSRLRDNRAIKPLTDMLKDENSQVREQAVSALGKFEGNQDVELIIELLKDGDCKVRQETAYMLGQVGDVRAVEPLISALLNDSDLLVREFAVEALNKFGDARAIAPLTSVLNDRDPNIGYAARNAIESIRNRNLL